MPRSPQPRAPWPPGAPDALLAAALACALIAVRALEPQGAGGGVVLGYALTAAAALATALRRRSPLAVYAGTLALALVVIALLPPAGAITLAVVVAVYTLAQVESRRRAVLLAVLAGVSLALARGLLQYKGWSDARTAVDPALVLAALFLGWALASGRAYVREMEARLAQAERTREEEARRRVDAERLRIARELHDVLAHSIATINVQAGVAAHLLRSRPEQAEQAMRAIKATSKEALRELRGVLGVMRQADEEAMPRQPAPGLGQLDALTATAIEAGLPTRIVTSGERRALPASVDLAAYRIVQEALTNVLRHAGPASALIAISYADGEVTISVDDDGRGRAAERGSVRRGHGIRGMAERAHALGGHLQAGEREGGGFRVVARLPTAPVVP